MLLVKRQKAKVKNHSELLPLNTLLSVFNGVNPNGTWSLYVFDDLGGDIGNFNGGWTLRITTDSCQPTMTPELFESLNAATEIEWLFNLPSMKFNQVIN